MRLNIIGNGFDLYHGLPSSYYYFGCFLAKNDYGFYQEMSQMYDFPCVRSVGYEDFEIFVDKIFWRTFEERLGVLDSTWIEESLIDDLGLENEDPVDIDMPEENNSERIKRKFYEWIKVTVDTERNYKMIKRKIGKGKLNLSREDYYINFNYTKTLEEIYRIPASRVYHIHGQCDDDVEGSNLIIGHGNDEMIKILEEQIARIESETYYLAEQSERNRLNEYKCERFILRDLRKNVESILDDLRHKLERTELEVEEIFVWGLSCGDIDKPYIEFLRKKYPNAKWKFSYYDMNEKGEREQYTYMLGLDESEVEYFELNNPRGKNICQELVVENGIEEF